MLNKLHNPSLGILLIRVALGLVFAFNGYAKITNMEGTIGFFASLGLAALFAYLVTAIELVGGILMLLGIFTRYVGVLLAIVMAGAIATVTWSRGFIGGYDFELTLLLVSLAVVFLGGGKYKVWKCCGPECKC